MLFVDVIEIVVWTQIAIIGMLFIFQPTKVTARLTIFYWLTLISHAVLFNFTPDFQDKQLWFYILGGFLDLIIIIYTCKIKEISRLIADIQDISLVSIMFNLFGLFLSYMDAEPELYMTLFAALYLWAIYVLLRGDLINGRFAEIDTRLLVFNRNANKWNIFNLKKQKKCQKE